jgi:hypothetical protein
MGYEGDHGKPGVTREEPVAERFRAMPRGLNACPDGGDVAFGWEPPA